MLLGRPTTGRLETINDADGFVSNFWRAVSFDAAEVAKHTDWPVNETDLFARHSWLVRHADGLLERLCANPEYYDARVAGWWCWGSCNWIGSGWCSGKGPWVYDGEKMINRKLPHLGDKGKGVKRQLPHLGDKGKGVNRKLPHLGDKGKGVNRQLPHLGDKGQGVNRQLPHLGNKGQGRSAFIQTWFLALQERMRDVRVACGDWRRVLTISVTERHGLTGIFFDPPYSTGEMDYAAGGVGGELAGKVRAWCLENGANKSLRIVLCGYAGEHDELLSHGWNVRKWKARKGYALTNVAKNNFRGESLWCSPGCIPECGKQRTLF
jgi:hypothetical protein